MKIKNIIILGIFLIILTPIVNAAVTAPYPRTLDLKPGESSIFKFQVQSNDPGIIECKYEEENEFPLDVEFQGGPQTTVDGREGEIVKKTIDAIITATEDLDYGTYTGSFCVSCQSIPQSAQCIDCDEPLEPTGASVSMRHCGLAITANVVEERTHPNMFEIPKEGSLIKFNMLTTILIISIIMVLIIIGIVIHNAKRRRNK